MITERPEHLNGMDAPVHNRAKGCFTLVLHYGGGFVTRNRSVVYEGGALKKWDFLQVKNLSVGLIKAYCDELRIKEVKKIHVQIEDGWLYIGTNGDLKKACSKYKVNREFHLWIDGVVMAESDSDGVHTVEENSENGDDLVEQGILAEPAEVEEDSYKSSEDGDYEEESDKSDEEGWLLNVDDTIEENVQALSPSGLDIDRLVRLQREQEARKGGAEGGHNGNGTGFGNDIGPSNVGPGPSHVLQTENAADVGPDVGADFGPVGADVGCDVGAEVGAEVGDESSYESEHIVIESDEEFDSALESDGSDIERPANRPKRVPYRPVDEYNPEFALGQTFSSKAVLKTAIHAHAVKTQHNLKVIKNDKMRLYAQCQDLATCPWRINARRQAKCNTFHISFYNHEHNCCPSYEVSNLSAKYLARRFLQWFRTDQPRSIASFRQDAMDVLNVDITFDQARRGRELAMKMVAGDPDVQYSKLFGYAEELRRSNPGTTVLVDTEENGTFKSIYVCFGALKKGFKKCRPLFGVDGCHLSYPAKGILLTCVAVDPNNKPYPVAWAIVEKEDKATWNWFFSILKVDLELADASDYTLISDKQKGLILAFEEQFVGGTHRFCIRHMWKNFYKAGFKGEGFRDALYKASNATTEGDFVVAIEELRNLDPMAVEWLNDKEPRHWSKAYFNTLPLCDMTLNNGCESFNKVLVPARDKPIITMLEWIREYMMTRLQKNRDTAIRRWKEQRLVPTITKQMHKNILRLNKVISRKSDDNNYQVREKKGTSMYNVDLLHRTCTCRKWQLTGIPCLHTVSALARAKEDPNEFVDECYTVDRYIEVYETAIYGINGADLWGDSFFIPPLPPGFGKHKVVGRPQKNRRKGAEEKVSKQKKRNKYRYYKPRGSAVCGSCGRPGHNRRRCPRNRPNLHSNVEEDENEQQQESGEIGEAGQSAEIGEEGQAGDSRDAGEIGEANEGDRLEEDSESAGDAEETEYASDKDGDEEDFLDFFGDIGDDFLFSSQITTEQAACSQSYKGKKGSRPPEGADWFNLTNESHATVEPVTKKRKSAKGIIINEPPQTVRDITSKKPLLKPPSLYKQLHPDVEEDGTFSKEGRKYVHLNKLKDVMNKGKGKRMD